MNKPIDPREFEETAPVPKTWDRGRKPSTGPTRTSRATILLTQAEYDTWTEASTTLGFDGNVSLMVRRVVNQYIASRGGSGGTKENGDER